MKNCLREVRFFRTEVIYVEPVKRLPRRPEEMDLLAETKGVVAIKKSFYAFLQLLKGTGTEVIYVKPVKRLPRRSEKMGLLAET